MLYKIINGSLSYDENIILERFDIEIHENSKIAIVGRNGCGKTTLLKALVGELEIEEGTGDESLSIVKANNPSIGYLKQMVFNDESITLEEELLNLFKDIFDLEIKIEEERKKMELDPSEANIKSYSLLLDEYERKDGYNVRIEIDKVLYGLNFKEEDKKRKLETFSGGEKTRISLMELLLSKPDILLLDEPTNNLDIETIEWLENRLRDYPKAIVMVSHDRMFIDKIANTVLEIEYGESKTRKGNYTHFIEVKKEEYEKAKKDALYHKKELQRLQKIVEKNLYKPTKSGLAKSVRKKIERMGEAKEPSPFDEKTYKNFCQVKRRSAEHVLEVKDLALGYENNVIQTINLDVYLYDKIGIIGPNGAGKSTFIKTILNDISQIDGEFKWGENVEIGYFDQTLDITKSTLSVYDAFRNLYPHYSALEARTALGGFGIVGDSVFKKLNELSGGEKVRFIMCQIFKSRPNVLILDEPTNHVDIIGKESLETTLKAYNGTLLLISHDRYLLKNVCTSFLIFKKDQVFLFKGTYDEYLAYEESLKLAVLEERTKKEEKANKVKIKQKSHKKEIEKLEKEISALEEEVSSLKEHYNEEEYISDYKKMEELDKNIISLEEKINELSTKWEELVLLDEE